MYKYDWQTPKVSSHLRACTIPLGLPGPPEPDNACMGSRSNPHPPLVSSLHHPTPTWGGQPHSTHTLSLLVSPQTSACVCKRVCVCVCVCIHPTVCQDSGRWVFTAQGASLEPWVGTPSSAPKGSKSISKKALACQVNSQYYSSGQRLLHLRNPGRVPGVRGGRETICCVRGAGQDLFKFPCPANRL